MAVAALSAEQVETLRSTVTGRVLTAGDDGYDDARRVHNGLIDRRPAVIALIGNAADASPRSASRAPGLEICVRGGGHNVAGAAVADGALMIDLLGMKGVDVDPDARTARAQGGVDLGASSTRATRRTASPSRAARSRPPGIAGLTLGGGLGWLMAKYGARGGQPALRRARHGRRRGRCEVTADSHPDLFWALRGGGGNFGVAASFDVPAAPAQMVVGGLIAHPFDGRAATAAVLPRRVSRTCPDELTCSPALVHAPDGSGMKLAAMVVCHTRHARAGRARPGAVQELGARRRGRGRADALSGDEHDARRRLPGGLAQLLDVELHAAVSPTALIDTMIERFATVPSPMSGDPARALPRRGDPVPVTETAVPAPRARLEPPASRRSGSDPAATDANIAWTRETLRGAAPSTSRPPLAELPRRRPGRRRHPRGVRPELRPAGRGQAPLRPGERLPPQPQHRPGRVPAIGASATSGREAPRGRIPRPDLSSLRGSGGSSSSASRRCSTLRERTPISRPPRRPARARRRAPRGSGTPRRAEVSVDRVVRRLGDRGERGRARVEPGGDDARDERLARDDAAEPSVVVDHVDRADLGRCQHLACLPRGSGRGQRPRLGDHRVPDPVCGHG